MKIEDLKVEVTLRSGGGEYRSPNLVFVNNISFISTEPVMGKDLDLLKVLLENYIQIDKNLMDKKSPTEFTKIK